MIPPLQQVRLRSIQQWLKDSDPQAATLPPAALEHRALELDEQMMETFEGREDQLKDKMMRDGTWGTEAGLTDFPMQRLQLWQEVTAEFLPTTALQSED